jgi:hypothetical protein
MWQMWEDWFTLNWVSLMSLCVWDGTSLSWFALMRLFAPSGPVTRDATMCMRVG